jgi:hypothetical protein
MKVIKPDTNIEVLQRSATLRISKKKKTEAAIIAIVPTKNVNAMYDGREVPDSSSSSLPDATVLSNCVIICF